MIIFRDDIGTSRSSSGARTLQQFRRHGHAVDLG
jgi:hypothetical protein